MQLQKSGWVPWLKANITLTYKIIWNGSLMKVYISGGNALDESKQLPWLMWNSSLMKVNIRCNNKSIQGLFDRTGVERSGQNTAASTEEECNLGRQHFLQPRLLQTSLRFSSRPTKQNQMASVKAHPDGCFVLSWLGYSQSLALYPL